MSSVSETTRIVGNDYVVQYQQRALQLDRRVRSRIPVKSRVLVREQRDGTLRVVYVARGARAGVGLDRSRPAAAEGWESASR